MLISILFTQPMVGIAWIIAIIVVLTVHEFAHAYSAYLLGDNTAKEAGRLTFNPLAHVSWLGFFMLLLVGFGWGKPVPFNPYNLKYKRFGSAIVAAAGPLANLLMAIVSLFVLKLVIVNQAVDPSSLLIVFLMAMLRLNLVLMLFNLLPFPPLDGSKILFSFMSDYKYVGIRQFLENQGLYILMFFIVFDNFLNWNLFGGLYSLVENIVYKFIM